MNRFVIGLLSMVLISVILLSCSVRKEVSLSSPSGNIEFFIKVKNFPESGSAETGIYYSVIFNEQTIIDDSPLDLEFKNVASLSGDLEIAATQSRIINEEWERIWGKRKKVVDRCYEMEVKFREKAMGKRKLNFVIRVYDDGIAFRYHIPEQDGIGEFQIASEKTFFCFTDDHKVWATRWGSFFTSQEQEFDEMRINDISEEDIIGTPLLVQVDNEAWAAIMEANLTDWAGMCITGGTEPNSVMTLLSPLPGEEDIVVKSKAPGFSPWRVIMLAEHPGRFIESDILPNLNDPCTLDDVSWIKPGKCAWDWWWNDGYAPDMGRKLGPDTESHKYFIDFASEMGWDYQLVDWYWYGPPFTSLETFEPNNDADITKHTGICDVPEIVEYAKSKGVKTIVWLEWHHVNRQMEEAFALYEKWGVSGIKVDFMNRNDQDMVNFYHRVVKKAAEHYLLVDFHGAYMPTGVERTYPNFITREGVLGNEYNKWSGRITPNHCLTLPFTRMLGGHMDFTPGGFVHGNKETFQIAGEAGLPYTMVIGTRCFQLAMMVVYESALQVICDSPYNYRQRPEGLDFLKIVPTTWDETVVINGRVGDYISVARKSGDVWFVGCMTDETARQLDIPLDFLDEGKYAATIWSDAPDADRFPEKLVKSNIEITKEDLQSARLAPAGGMVMYLTPVN